MHVLQVARLGARAALKRTPHRHRLFSAFRQAPGPGHRGCHASHHAQVTRGPATVPGRISPSSSPGQRTGDWLPRERKGRHKIKQVERVAPEGVTACAPLPRPRIPCHPSGRPQQAQHRIRQGAIRAGLGGAGVPKASRWAQDFWGAEGNGSFQGKWAAYRG